jgi:TonB family protein
MLVTSGPAGGGGLSVYGVLRGGKIYTIYLPMPGKHWILQYCAATKPTDDPSSAPRSVQVRLDPVLAPPSVEEEFDFHRPPVPKDKMAEVIVLHGVIREDGSVAELKVLKGLDDLADQAAVAAFVRWKFKPALRAGGAVPVEILVGIPAM